MNKKERKEFDRTKGMRSPMLGKWKQRPSPKSQQYGHGCVKEMDRAFTDGVHAVLVRTVETKEYGPITHVAIRNVFGTDIPWAEKQRIKNELFGDESMAIEIFPRVSRLIDEAPMYHLWVFPDNTFQFPFGLHEMDNL